MNYFALLLFVLSSLSAVASPITVRHFESSKQAFNGPDRTITWRPWQQSPKGDFRFRTGDRYLGGQLWEHYLGFEERRILGVGAADFDCFYLLRPYSLLAKYRN
jgi:hypothetical protein